MSNTLLIKRSSTPNAVPSTANLVLGELAINTYDGRLFTKIDTGTPSIFELTQNQPITATGNVTGTSVNGVGNSTINLTLTTTGVASGTYGGTSGATSNIGVFTVDQYGRITSASNVAISTSSLANGNANIEIYANGNISLNPAGTSNVVVIANTGQYITGESSVSGNITGANVNTGGVVSATGNIVSTANVTGGNLTTGGLITATGNVTGGNVTTGGLITATGNATAGNINTGGAVSATGNVQGGNLRTTGLISATGNITGGNISTAGNVAANGVLTDNYYYANGTPVDFQQAAGSNTQIQFNNNNDFGASANLTFNSATDVLTVTGTASVSGNVNSGAVSASGNITAANFATSGSGGNITGANVISSTTLSATANVIGGNLVTSGNVSVTGFVSSTGNVISGNVNTSGLVTATGNVTAGNINTGGLVTATGNVTGGNLQTGGQVSATGNVNGGNLVAATLVQGTTLSATANVIAGNVSTTGLVTATGNVTAGNVNTAGLASVAGNVIGGNITTGGQVSATGNITSGNLSTGIITASGNVTGANFLTGGLISSTGNVTGGNVIAVTAVQTPNVNSTGAMSVSTGSGDLLLSPAGNINVDSNYINNLASPVQSFDAATKQYVDDAVSTGITIHTPVLVESPTALSATYAQGGTTHTVTDITTGNTLTFSASHGLTTNDQIYWSSAFNGILANTSYFVFSVANATAVTLANIYGGPQLTGLSNGTGLTETGRANPGVGATLTATANGAANIDGVLVSANARVLVYQQANAAHNGVYVVTDTGNVTAPFVFTRSSDTNTYQPASINGLDAGDYFFVQSGDTGAGESYVLTAPVGEIILGYDNLTFTQFSASQVYTANTAAGISLTGTVFSAKVDNNTTAFDGGGNIIVKASANLTTPNIGAATGTSVSVTGNVTGGNVNFDAGVVSGTGNVIAGNLLTGGIMSATGNVTGGNVITGGLINATGNVSAGNFLTGGLISAAGTVTAANLQLGDTANVATLIVRTFANITATTLSTSNTTGALRVAGGIGVTGNVYADGMYVLGDSVLTVNSTIDCGTY